VLSVPAGLPPGGAGPVAAAALSPWDETLLAAAGPGGARLLRLDYGGGAGAASVARSRLLSDAPPRGGGGHGAHGARTGSSGGGGGPSASAAAGCGGATCLAFLVGGLAALGTDTGCVVMAGEGGAAPARVRLGGAAAGAAAGAAGGGVQAMAPRGRGLVVAAGDGFVYFLEPCEASSRRDGALRKGGAFRGASWGGPAP
jgi:hypothetical protein